MVEVQDIDALLIGALYGELTPADEARLAAHLESHPTDKTALDQLTHARGLIRPYLSELVDPPQAISALLLQEAVRRAPARPRAASAEESWFTRFIRSFASHPAMAAAAMLVVVIGVAGTLYMKKGSAQFADEKAVTIDQSAQLDRAAGEGSAPTARFETETPEPPPAAQAPAIGAAAAGSGSAYGADLAFKEANTHADRARELEVQKSKVAAVNERAVRHQGITVKDGQQLMPRDLAEAPMDDDKGKDEKKPVAPAEKQDADQQSRSGAPGGPPPPKATVAAEPPRPAPAQTVARDGDANTASWTRTEHARAIAYVKAGNCAEAAKVAVGIADRDPDYFAQNIATDRALKPCMPNITQLRDIESEKMQKARAQKRVNANEPAPADSLK